MSEIDDVKAEVAAATRALAELGLSDGVSAGMGHISVRLPSDPEKFVVKGRGYARDLLTLMRPQDMVVCNLDGRLVQGPEGIQQCFEVMLHACALRARPDVNSVIHVHPRYLLVLSLMGRSPMPARVEGCRLLDEPIPLYKRARVVIEQDEAEEVVALLADRPAVSLQGHGLLSVGASAGEAAMRTLQLEEQAYMNWLLLAAGGADALQAAQPLYRDIVNHRYDGTTPAHFNGPLKTNRQSLWEQTVEEMTAQIAAE